MGKFKIWEILLFVAVVLLAALVYESHNDGGRYVPYGFEELPPVLDTRTGTIWIWDTDKDDWRIMHPAIPKGF